MLQKLPGVAVDAADEVDVVRARGVGVRGLHGRDVEAAVGELGMAVAARFPSVVGMGGVACRAAQAFVDASRGAVVAGTGQVKRVGRVALYADALALVGTDRDGRAVEGDPQRWQLRRREV